MKKSKILIPVLSIAGLGATIAPMMVMTSCGKPQDDSKEIVAKQNALGYVYIVSEGNMAAGKYKLIIDNTVQTDVEFSYIKACQSGGTVVVLFTDPNKIKITAGNDQLEATNDYTCDTYGQIIFQATGSEKTKNNIVVVEFEIPDSFKGKILNITIRTN